MSFDHNGWRNARARERLDFLDSYLEDNPCVDCGFSDPRALDFDHVSGVKIRGVKTMAWAGQKWETILAEIAKCEVRCSNCHRIATLERRRSAENEKDVEEST